MKHEMPSPGEGAPQADVNSPELMEQALSRTKVWLGEWYSDFQIKTGLTPANLRSRTSLMSILDLPDALKIKTDKGEGTYQIFNISKEMKALFGTVSFVRLVQAFRGSAPRGAPEGMMVMASPKDFEEVNAMSMGWHVGESDITYMSVAFSEKGDASIVQLTRPGELFRGFTGRLNKCQAFTFKVDRGEATVWKVSLGLEGEDAHPMMSMKSGGAVSKDPGSMDYILPDVINIPKALDNIIAGKPATAA